MKRLISSIIITCMLLMSFSTIAYAENLQPIIDAEGGAVGDTITVTVSLPENTNASGGSFNLVYDNTKMKLETAETGELVSGYSSELNKDYAENKIRMNFLGQDAVSANGGELLKATFTLTDDGEAVFSTENFKLVDFEGNYIACNDNSKSITIVVPVADVILDKTSITLKMGENETETLIATVLPENATNKGVIWWSSDENVAIVENGVVTAISAGIADIFVETLDGGFVTSCFVTVEPDIIPVTAVTLNKSFTTLYIGETETLIATVFPEDATNQAVTWISSDEDIATVEDGVITAKKAGYVSIAAIVDDGDYFFMEMCEVTVKSPIIRVTGVSLDKNFINLEVGDTEILTATVLPENATNKAVKWISDNEEVVTVSENGVVTAIDNGVAVIMVITEDGQFIATCEVTVEPRTIPVTGVSLDKNSINLEVGDTEILTATVLPEDATNKNVSWSSLDESIVTVEDGVLTAKKAGFSTIVVTTEEGNHIAMCDVTVKDPVIPVSGLSLDKTDIELDVGETETLTATVSPENATNKNVIWFSDNGEVASVENGVVTAKKAGSATIMVMTEDGYFTETCTVSVKDPIIRVTGISFDKKSVVLKIGESETLTATVLPENATNKAIRWISSNPSVATIEDGVVTLVGSGNATIMAITEDGGFIGICSVREKYVPVEGIKLDKSAFTIKAGETENITALVIPDDATNKTVRWISSNSGVATVEDGAVTANKKGKVTILAITDDGGFIGMCSVTVEAIIPVKDVKLNKETLDLTVRETQTLIATVTPEDATNKSVIWHSDNEDVAKVSEDGVVTAISEGTAVITVETFDGGKTASCDVTVKRPKVTLLGGSAMAGETVQVIVNLENNVGFTNLSLEVDYDSDVMELTDIKDVPHVDGIFVKSEDFTADPYRMIWTGVEDVEYNGKLAVLTFLVKEDAKSGEYPVNIDYFKGANGDFVDGLNVNINEKGESIDLEYGESCNIVVDSYTPGDVNVDGSIDNNDVTSLLDHIMKGDIDSELLKRVLDVNKDGRIDMKDAIMLLQYLAGWNITLR